MAEAKSENKPSHRELKKEECRAAIRSAAVRLFEEKGFDVTTMDEIAQAAKVSRPTVFNYFPRKEDILLGLGATMNERIALQVRAMQGEAAFEDPIGTLRRVVVTIATAFAEYPETSRAYHFLHMQEARHGRHGKPAEHSPGRPIQEQRAFFYSLIERAQAKGLVRTDFTPAEILRHLMIGLFASTMGAWFHGEYGTEPLPSIVERHFDLYVRGIRR